MFPKFEEVPVMPGAPEACETCACGDGKGPLPGCAPLAVSYVPVQPAGAKKYSQMEALENGTLFPGLNLPFHLKVEPGKVQDTPLAELQALAFVLAELGLYLDTHKEDLEAFQLFQKYAALEKEGRARYEALYGPLTQSAAADGKGYDWVCDPWPWTLPEGGKR